MENTRIILYVGIAYHLICSFFVGVIIEQTKYIGSFGKYALVLCIAIGMWHSILLWLRCLDEKD
jgi:hypothetical protein|nr:MAG TPA: hypothetical protein [Caudoviricetes sp.]